MKIVPTWLCLNAGICHDSISSSVEALSCSLCVELTSLKMRIAAKTARFEEECGSSHLILHIRHSHTFSFSQSVHVDQV